MHAEHPLAQDNVRGDTGAAEEPPVELLSSSHEWMSVIGYSSTGAQEHACVPYFATVLKAEYGER